MKRNLLLVLTLVCLCSFASAQTKMTSTWTCPKQDPSQTKSLEVPDKAGHAYVIFQFKCTANSGDVAGSTEKEGSGTEFVDATGDTSTGHGVFMETLASGDKLRTTYTSKSTMKGGQFVSGTNKFQIAGVSGKAKGIKGSGTCEGKGNPDGSSSWTCTWTSAK